jgi:hypothetical protein
MVSKCPESSADLRKSAPIKYGPQKKTFGILFFGALFQKKLLQI